MVDGKILVKKSSFTRKKRKEKQVSVVLLSKKKKKKNLGPITHFVVSTDTMELKERKYIEIHAFIASFFCINYLKNKKSNK